MHYEKGKTECPIGKPEFTKRVKAYFKMGLDKLNTLELQKAETVKALMDAEMSRMTESVVKGQPGFYSNLHHERGLKYLNEYNKIVFGSKEKHEHIHIGGDELAKKIVTDLFKEKEKESGEDGNAL